MIEVVIADDHKLFAQGLASVLNSDPELEVNGIFTDGKSMIDYLQHHAAQVALIDLNMPFFNGESTLKRLNELGIKLHKIVVTMYADEALVKTCLSLGIDAYLLKDTEPNVVIDTIKAVVAGTYVMEKDLGTSHNSATADFFKDDFINSHKLSKREMEIVQLVVKGLSSAEIAETLFLSTFTVETHRRNIHQKLKVKNTAELVKIAMEQNIAQS
jgi:DNA-binding NarL/FixJ family response regulator